ncbi:MAG: tetratricopeptide repeat protein [Alphaproteobacteria bacterium]|nr:tetratricopeptide repeat protein [Alphaproteobacteria bacterium]MBU2271270.1 tetratricopeptide repeat protein [Alphaproteobacteria bacterium]
MRVATGLAIILCLGAATPAAAQVVETDVAAFQRLRAEGVAAASAGDLATASARLAEAAGRIPNHPGLMLMRARVAVGAGQPAQAIALLSRYAGSGLIANLDGDRALSTLAGQPGFNAVTAAMEVNRAPVGADRLTAVAAIAGDGLVESVARDEARGRWLAALVRGRTILAVDDAGAISPFLAPDPAIGGVLGLALDAPAGVLWAATSPAPPAVHGLAPEAPRPAPALLKIDLATGRVLARYPAPGGDQMLGDVLLAADGTVHIAGGDLLQLRPGSEALEVLTPAGLMRSPQGMAATPDGAALIVADYSSGLWRVDRATGAAARLQAPDDVSLIGVDGLTRVDDALYGFQNGVAPQRVLKLTLDAGWSRIEAVQVLAANLPQLDEPTTGLVHDGELVFVSRSQWSDFDGEGAPRAPSPEPALISRLRLD